jgi:hypothetical protein
MRSLPALLLLLPLVACDSNDYGEAEVTGAIGPLNLESKDVTVYHGTRHVVMVDRKIDCLDMSWVTRNYFVEDITSPVEFGAIQFTFDSETPEQGTFTLEAGEGAVSAYRILNLDLPTDNPPPLDFDRSRDGTLTIDSANDDEVVGSFDVIFADSNAGGTFRSAHCRNVR